MQDGTNSTMSSAVEKSLGGSMEGWSVVPAVQWLFSLGKHQKNAGAALEGVCARLVEAGAPIFRVRLNSRTLHPRLVAMSYVWQQGRALRTFQVAHEITLTDAFVGSPIAHIYETGESIRRRIEDVVEGVDHGTFLELRDAGGTDYLALPTYYGTVVGGAMTFASDHPDGFCDDDLVKLHAVVDFMAPVLDAYSMRHVARSLLDTYVGPRTGDRVLNGQIQRGDAEEIDAAMWFSDLRDFTPLSESLELPVLIGMLNQYFELVAAAVTARDGEILRFIGDAMLIVFPLENGRTPATACRAALDSAEDAFASLATLNHRRQRNAEPAIRFGVGLHFGTVIYGNVGAPDRLDFTVMGAAVNRTARLESLTKTLLRPLLMSREFAQHLDVPTQSLGHHMMKGVPDAREVFALEAQS